jgi:hypothetical protein
MKHEVERIGEINNLLDTLFMFLQLSKYAEG